MHQKTVEGNGNLQFQGAQAEVSKFLKNSKDIHSSWYNVKGEFCSFGAEMLMWRERSSLADIFLPQKIF